MKKLTLHLSFLVLLFSIFVIGCNDSPLVSTDQPISIYHTGLSGQNPDGVRFKFYEYMKITRPDSTYFYHRKLFKEFYCDDCVSQTPYNDHVVSDTLEYPPADRYNEDLHFQVLYYSVDCYVKYSHEDPLLRGYATWSVLEEDLSKMQFNHWYYYPDTTAGTHSYSEDYISLQPETPYLIYYGGTYGPFEDGHTVGLRRE